MSGINSGHNEILHTNKYETKNSDSIEKEKEEIARKLREKYTNNPSTRSNLNKNATTISSTTREVSNNIDGKGISTRPLNISVNLRDADIISYFLWFAIYRTFYYGYIWYIDRNFIIIFLVNIL